MSHSILKSANQHLYRYSFSVLTALFNSVEQDNLRFFSVGQNLQYVHSAAPWGELSSTDSAASRSAERASADTSSALQTWCFWNLSYVPAEEGSETLVETYLLHTCGIGCYLIQLTSSPTVTDDERQWESALTLLDPSVYS